jgi:hypothetical protein
VTPSAGEHFPSVDDVVTRFRRVLEDATPLPRSDGVLGLLLALHRNNLEQWRREDVTRVRYDDDTEVAAAKRDIDDLNATRHLLVEAIDAALVDSIEQDAAATPVTESPAMVFDRLSVITIRIHFTENAARADTADRDAYAERLPLLRNHLADVQEALVGLFDDVLTGRKRFVPYQSLKLYGSA